MKSSPVSDEVICWFWRIPEHWTSSGGFSVAERRRAAGYATSLLRRHYEASVYFRRRILGELLGLSPEELEFEVNELGKPALAAKQNPAGWHFNLAHSADAMVLALACQREIGVDVERIRPSVNWRGVAETAFTEAERRGMDDLGAFYARWTAKEAYLKACGQGLGAPLQDISVQVSGPFVEVQQSFPGDERQWWGWNQRPDPDVFAAVVLQRHTIDTARPRCRWSQWGHEPPMI